MQNAVLRCVCERAVVPAEAGTREFIEGSLRLSDECARELELKRALERRKSARAADDDGWTVAGGDGDGDGDDSIPEAGPGADDRRREVLGHFAALAGGEGDGRRARARARRDRDGDGDAGMAAIYRHMRDAGSLARLEARRGRRVPGAGEARGRRRQ